MAHSRPWALDTSLLYQIALAPAASPDWETNVILGALGVGLALIGAWWFNSRDLQTE
jgi:hypothetical protein